MQNNAKRFRFYTRSICDLYGAIAFFFYIFYAQKFSNISRAIYPRVIYYENRSTEILIVDNPSASAS